MPSKDSPLPTGNTHDSSHSFEKSTNTQNADVGLQELPNTEDVELRNYPINAWVQYLYACDNQDPVDKASVIEQYTDNFYKLIQQEANRQKIELLERLEGKVEATYVGIGYRHSIEKKHIEAERKQLEEDKS